MGLAGLRLLADPSIMDLEVAATGANKTDTHLVGVHPGRDFEPDAVVDLRLAQAGQPCPRCGSPLDRKRGIQIGRIDDHLPIESTRPQQGPIKHFRAIGGGQQDDTHVGFETIHFNQQLV